MTGKKKINILFVIVQMKMGGSESLVLNLVRKLDRNLFTPHIAWLYEESPLAEFKELGIPLFFIPKKKRVDFSTIYGLSRVIRNNSIQVVNAHHFLPLVYSFLGAKIMNNTKLIYTEHSEWEINEIKGKWLTIGKRMLRYTDGVVGISKRVSSKLQNTLELPDNKTHTIANGIDCCRFSMPHDNDSYKKKYGIGTDNVVIGIVANLKVNKNHIFLLKSFFQLWTENKKLKLLIIGEGFENDPEGSEEDIRDFISDSGLKENVLLMGARSDVPELLKAMDIFCLVSYKEGLPISITEAMASGLPVVGTDVEGIRDVITHHKTGFLVPLNDVDKLTDTLKQLINNTSLRMKLGMAARDFVYTYYDLDKSIRIYQELFS